MKKTIAEILMQNFDRENYATHALLNQFISHLKNKKQWQKLSNDELEKVAIEKIKKGEKIVTNHRRQKLEKYSEEWILRQKEDKQKFYLKTKTEEYKQKLKEIRLKSYSKNKEKRSQQRKLYYQKNREKLAEKRCQESIKIN